MKKFQLFLGASAIVLALFVGLTGCEQPALNSGFDSGSAGSLSISDSVKAGTATVSNVTVLGASGSAISSVQLTITLDDDLFNRINAGVDVSAWFTNLPGGLTAATAAIVQPGAQIATITISGTPTIGSAQVMAITIPGSYLDSGAPSTVTTNPAAKYDIAQSVGSDTDFAAWAAAVNAGDTAQRATLTGNVTLPAGASYVPVASVRAPYTGIFEGGNYTLTYTLRGSTSFLALFAMNQGTIQNLTVAGTLTATYTDTAIDYVAGVVGYNDITGRINHVISQVTVTTSVNNVYNIGGITGFNGWDQYNQASPHYNVSYQPGGYIYQCRNEGDVTGGFNKIGGIAGENAYSVEQCSNYGTITCAKTVSNWPGVGGIAGRNGNNDSATELGQIVSCYNRGKIVDTTTERTSHDGYGGITGWCNNSSTVANCYDTGDFDFDRTINCMKNPIIGRVDSTTGRGSDSYSLDSVWAQSPADIVLSGTREPDAYMRSAAFVTADLNGGAYAAYVAVTGDYPKLAWE
jgi:hypothetical protein